MPEAKLDLTVMEEFDTEFLLHAPEIYIFSACRHVVELFRAAERGASAEETRPPADADRFDRLFAQLIALAQATERFDILVPFTLESSFSPFFWRWFNWWRDYRQGLKPKELDRIHRLQDSGDPAALDYRPTGDWLTYRDTPPLEFQIRLQVKPSRKRAKRHA